MRAIAAGVVVHTNLVPGYSNYGKYVVVEHRWDGCKYYSLYGHLSSIQVQVGQRVEQRDQLGRDGPYRRRLEPGARASASRTEPDVEPAVRIVARPPFPRAIRIGNGLYNGLNLIGLDIARLYLALQKRPSLTIPEFLAEEETLYRVLLPGSKNFDLAKVLSLDGRSGKREKRRRHGKSPSIAQACR